MFVLSLVDTVEDSFHSSDSLVDAVRTGRYLLSVFVRLHCLTGRSKTGCRLTFLQYHIKFIVILL